MSIAIFIYDPAGPGVPILCHFKKFKVRNSASSRPGRLQCLVCNIHHELDHFTVGERERERERNITSCCSAMLSTDSRLWMAQLPSSAKLEAAPLHHTYNLLLHFSIAVMLSQIRRLGLKTETSRFFVSPPASAPRQIITWRRMAYECVVTGATGCVGYI